MAVSFRPYVASKHAVKVAGGGKSLSVLATPQSERDEATYELSESDRETLRKVLAEDIEAPQAPDGP